MIKNLSMRLVVVMMVVSMLSAASVSAQDSALSPELLSRILSVIASDGIYRDVPPEISNALGLSGTGQGWPSRQLAVKDTSNNVSHAIAISRDTDQDIVLNRRSLDSFSAFRIKRDGTLVTAVRYDLNTGRLVVRSRAEAQKELNGEIAYWDPIRGNGAR